MAAVLSSNVGLNHQMLHRTLPPNTQQGVSQRHGQDAWTESDDCTLIYSSPFPDVECSGPGGSARVKYCPATKSYTQGISVCGQDEPGHPNEGRARLAATHIPDSPNHNLSLAPGPTTPALPLCSEFCHGASACNGDAYINDDSTQCRGPTPFTDKPLLPLGTYFLQRHSSDDLASSSAMPLADVATGWQRTSSMYRSMSCQLPRVWDCIEEETPCAGCPEIHRKHDITHACPFLAPSLSFSSAPQSRGHVTRPLLDPPPPAHVDPEAGTGLSKDEESGSHSSEVQEELAGPTEAQGDHGGFLTPQPTQPCTKSASRREQTSRDAEEERDTQISSPGSGVGSRGGWEGTSMRSEGEVEGESESESEIQGKTSSGRRGAGHTPLLLRDGLSSWSVQPIERVTSFDADGASGRDVWLCNDKGRIIQDLQELLRQSSLRGHSSSTVGDGGYYNSTLWVTRSNTTGTHGSAAEDRLRGRMGRELADMETQWAEEDAGATAQGAVLDRSEGVRGTVMSPPDVRRLEEESMGAFSCAYWFRRGDNSAKLVSEKVCGLFGRKKMPWRGFQRCTTPSQHNLSDK